MKLQKQFPDSFCKEYKLNTASATGDLSMRLMLILNHLRRISRSGTCWKQATTTLTSMQSEELLELALCVRETLFKTSLSSSSMVSDSKESDDDVFVQPRVLGKKMSNASEVTHVQIICLLFGISLIFISCIYIFMYIFWFALQVSIDSVGLPKPPNMDHLFSKPAVKKTVTPQKKPAASPTAVAKAKACDATAADEDDFVVEQSTLSVTKATAQSYIWCFTKKRLVVAVTKKSVPNHKVFIEKLLKFCKTPGVTKSQVVQHRNKLLA